MSPLLETARDLSAQFKSRAFEADQTGELPLADVEALYQSDLLTAVLPKSYGGHEASLTECTRLQLELAKGSGSTALAVAMTLHIMSHARETQPWPKAIFQALCQEVAAGALINSVASEPRLGSPSRGGLPDSYAERKGESFVVNGHKTWVTGGTHLKHLLVRVRLGDEAVTLWIPGDNPGLRWEKTWGDGLSLRASDSHDLYLENVAVSLDHIAEQGKGKANVWFPILMAATYLGIAFAARDEAIQYALERVPTALGKPIATLPKIQRQIGEIDVALQAAEALLLKIAGEWQGNLADLEQFLPKTAAAKHLATETALDVTDKAMRLVGAAGLDKSLGLERYFRDVRAGLMHPPSGDAALEIIGRAALGL